MSLSTAMKNTVVGQISQQFWSLLQSLHTWIQSNPTATSTQALNYLNGLPDPYPDDVVKIVDRTSAFTWLANQIHPYEGKATAYLSLRQFMLDNPLNFLKYIDPDFERTAKSRAEALLIRMTSSAIEGYAKEAASITNGETRDPAKGNYVTQETVTGTIGGTTYTVARSFTLTQNAEGGWDSVAGDWVVL